jgi:hypothetical protein
MLKKSFLKRKSNLNSVSFLSKKSTLVNKTTLHKNCALTKSGINLNKNVIINKQSESARSKWEAIRKKALIRDNYKCIVCGKPACHVHHIHLRSVRKDLVYNLNTLVSLCSVHHFHRGTEKYKEQTELIAKAKHMSVEELLKFAETKEEDNNGTNN